jgi:hypothetical protein
VGREVCGLPQKVRGGHVAAVVLVPRGEVIVRTLQFPAVGDKLEAAIGFQLDTLHPYAEDDAVAAFARLEGAQVLIGILRRQRFAAYQTLFTEAGVKVVSFTFFAAAIYSASPHDRCRAQGFSRGAGDGRRPRGLRRECGRPVFSSVFDLPRPRALALAVAELRLPPETEPIDLGAAMAQAAALTAARRRPWPWEQTSCRRRAQVEFEVAVCAHGGAGRHPGGAAGGHPAARAVRHGALRRGDAERDFAKRTHCRPRAANRSGDRQSQGTGKAAR